ncbi:uncharacterized protein [Pithys albifrons albifrons]|uniref:uncharacterized protein n=1 Tax=Pithys albifrons albifrons TaxID=3385563 RepID=UPI003A5CC07E
MAAGPATRLFRFALYALGGLGRHLRPALKRAARTALKLASVGPLGSDRRLPACLIPSLPPLAAPSPRRAFRPGPGPGGLGGGGGSRAAGRHLRSFRSVRPAPLCTRCRPCIAAMSPRAAHRDRADPPPERHIAAEAGRALEEVPAALRLRPWPAATAGAGPEKQFCCSWEESGPKEVNPESPVEPGRDAAAGTLRAGGADWREKRLKLLGLCLFPAVPSGSPGLQGLPLALPGSLLRGFRMGQ